MLQLTRISLLLPLAVVAACAAVPVNHSDAPTANFVEVSPGIFRGARPDRAALERLAGMSFRTVLNLEDDEAAIDEERVSTGELGLKQVVARMNGLANPSNQAISTAVAALADPASRPVFVHCMKGQDRTGVVIALHRVFNEGWSAEVARAEMMTLGFNPVLLTLKEYFEKKVGLDD